MVPDHPATLGATATAVPFLDLSRIHEALKPAIESELSALIDSGAFSNGPQVREFEQAFAAACGVGECVGVASGLDALRLALIGAGLEPGDEVIVPAHTFVATWEAVTQAGGVPVAVDISAADDALDVSAAERARTGRARFVVPVHMYGQMADMRALQALAAGRGLEIVEDACQAHAATRDGIAPGGASRAAAFSFYPSKNLGAMGDAGALVTADAELAARVRALREHGQTRKYEHSVEGWTARLDTIQALVLLEKLPYLAEWTAARRAAAAFYDDALADVRDVRLPPVAPGSEPVWYVYVVRVEEPARLARFLGERGIATGRHYPEPPHLSRAYAHLGHERGDFPIAERLADTCLSLPIFPGITEDEQTAVVAGVRAFFGG
jgi:dTDP-4-amino-4,6-dideoxygalactose transaminase